MWSFPARFLAEFFDNHGMLGLRGRPRWRTVTGGSHRYVEALDRAVRATACGSPRRCARSSATRTASTSRRAAASPSASTRSSSPPTPTRRSRMLADADAARARDPRRDPLPGQRGGPAHRPGLLPRRRRAWASWNYHLLDAPAGRADRDLPHEPPAVARDDRAVLRDAQPHGRDRPGRRSSARSSTRTRSTRRRACAPSAATTRSAAAAARTSAAPTGAGASTRTASRARVRVAGALGGRA